MSRHPWHVRDYQWPFHMPVSQRRPYGSQSGHNHMTLEVSAQALPYVLAIDDGEEIENGCLSSCETLLTNNIS